MKVVTQLVRYFWQRGTLTQLEIESLLRHGFVRASDLPGFKPSKKTNEPITDPALIPQQPIEYPTDLESEEELLIRRHTVRTGEPGSKGKVLEVEDLLERLRSEYERRERDLVSLHNFGSRYGDCENWYDAAIALRQLSMDDFYNGFRENLSRGSVLLGDLWQAVDPEPLHTLIADNEIRGRATQAFTALLVADDSQDLGRYVWLLKHDEMKAVINLRVVHERLLACLCMLYQRDMRLLTAALQKNCDPIQFWALLLLYNAHRESTANDLPAFGREYGPVTLPALPVWQQAWNCALAMDRPHITKLLVTCYTGADDAEDVVGTPCGKNIMCPVGWHVPER
jgi:hypothetical protein